ncbi:2,5-diketo-D-gluconic acid reductase [Aureimonas altamirensis]|uniref:2,5-diketo-D-gluconic acid reductase n=1 Tax=Aureimonas altamirensis TaxID=370622 RepID=A0A0B1Q5R4_9HYPH|nr:aldo/keto reductase [Aureimonas altamirensis]KHJ54721.1 2,5-diketo-D-gluconic acid reductase [Aureimonas altamirensis]
MDKPIPDLELNDGTQLPALGFGTYKLNGRAGVDTMVRAMRNGYGLLDSAFNYENEGAVGAAVKASGLARDTIRVTSKLPGRRHRYAEARATVEESLFRTGLDHLDIYLIHWPNPKTGLYVEAWQALVDAQKAGLVRTIGVCNFLPEHIERIVAETGVVPAINQVELHPYFPQAEQLAFDRSKGIVTQAWSPLGRANDIIRNETIGEIARRHGRSIPQIILRWQVQQGAVPLPKATSDERQVENRSVFDFELSRSDMDTIASLARPDGRLADQDPTRYEEF